jgi:hypothetical protein
MSLQPRGVHTISNKAVPTIFQSQINLNKIFISLLEISPPLLLIVKLKIYVVFYKCNKECNNSNHFNRELQ